MSSTNASRSSTRNGLRPAASTTNGSASAASVHARRQRALHAILIEKEHPILAPRPASDDEHELATAPRVERMRHTDGSLPTSAIRRS
jgi:hypothetical protein